MHTVSGHCEAPLPPTLAPSDSGSALFSKTAGAACGAVGVFTYDLLNGSTKQYDGKLAVMFSNPYDFNLYSNWYAVGVFDLARPCDHELYKHMYNSAEKEFVRGKAKGAGLTHSSHRLTVRATMSDSYQPVLKVQVCRV